MSFSYDAAPDGLFHDVRFGVSEGWIGLIGPNGAGKTTLLRLACGELAPRAGSVEAPRRALYCPQRTDKPMSEFARFLDATDGEAYRIRGRLGIEGDWLTRWATLSHGERKRAQIGTCLWLQPDLLAVDEPTNHLDLEARRMVFESLRSYRGVGLLVSHDRKLLDDLCTHCLFVDPPDVVLRSGGYTIAREALQQEAKASREVQRRARNERKKIERELIRRREHQQKADRGRSKRGIDRHDHDAKEKIDRARVSDSGSGKRLRQLKGRLQHARQSEDSISAAAQASLWAGFNGEVSQRNTLFRIESDTLPLSKQRKLLFPKLVMQPRDRIALVGPNGAGKSTLIRHILRNATLPEEVIVYIPQEISEARSQQIIEEARRLSGEALGQMMKRVSRLGSRPERLLESRVPSPGEVRKLILAMTIAQRPQLLVMDEPTNHMDLPSIECLEDALRECRCGLLLVSHDQPFLEALTTIRWEIAPLDDVRTWFELVVTTSTPPVLS